MHNRLDRLIALHRRRRRSHDCDWHCCHRKWIGLCAPGNWHWLTDGVCITVFSVTRFLFCSFDTKFKFNIVFAPSSAPIEWMAVANWQVQTWDTLLPELVVAALDWTGQDDKSRLAHCSWGQGNHHDWNTHTFSGPIIIYSLQLCTVCLSYSSRSVNMAWELFACSCTGHQYWTLIIINCVARGLWWECHPGVCLGTIK